LKKRENNPLLAARLQQRRRALFLRLLLVLLLNALHARIPVQPLLTLLLLLLLAATATAPTLTPRRHALARERLEPRAQCRILAQRRKRALAPLAQPLLSQVVVGALW